jgi:hypothetical protein
METVSEDHVPDGAEIVERVRDFVRSLLGEGVNAAQVSSTLAFVATELGLCIAKEPVHVFAVVLDAIARAASASGAQTASSSADSTHPEVSDGVPDGVTLQ